MAVEIPTRSDLGRYRFSIRLTGARFIFVFVYNRRDAHWYFDIVDNDGAAIRQGVKVTSNFPLLRQLVQQGRPSGYLYAVNPFNGDDPTEESFGDQVKFAYEAVA